MRPLRRRDTTIKGLARNQLGSLKNAKRRLCRGRIVEVVGTGLAPAKRDGKPRHEGGWPRGPVSKKLTQKPPVWSGLKERRSFSPPVVAARQIVDQARGVWSSGKGYDVEAVSEGSTERFGDFVSGISTAGRDVGQLHDCESKESVGLLLLAGM